VEHHASDQEPAVAESSHAAEERAEHIGNNEQHGVDQRSEGLMLNADAPDATSSSTIGVMLGTRTGNDNPAAEEDAPEAAVIEEEPKIKEIVTPQVFSSLIALHLHEHKQASFISCISL
jgi:hypothetical protein